MAAKAAKKVAEPVKTDQTPGSEKPERHSGWEALLPEFTGDINKMFDQLTEVLNTLTDDTNAVVFNATKEQVRFFCYNDSDALRWIPAREPICPPGTNTLVNKGPLGWGPTIQIWVNKEKGPFYVKRNHAYIWNGTTFLEKDEVAEKVQTS